MTNTTTYELHVAVRASGLQLTPKQCLHSTTDAMEAQRYYAHFMGAGHLVQVRRVTVEDVTEAFVTEYHRAL